MGLADILFSNKRIHQWVNHRNLYILGLITIACGLAWSHILMSIGQFILIGNWLIEFEFARKWKTLKSYGLLHLLLLLFTLHFIGMAWSDDLTYGFKDLRVKLPLIVLPLIIGTTKKLNKTEWKVVIGIYLSTLFCLTIASLWKFLGLSGIEITDKRQLSIYISHIRYGLNLVFGLFLLFYFRTIYGSKIQWILLVLASWFVLCLLLFQLYSALFIFAIITGCIIYYHLLSQRRSKALQLSALVLIGLLSLSVYYLIQSVRDDFYRMPQLNYDQLDLSAQYSQSGMPYWHDIKDVRKENGVYIRRFVVWKEIEKEWNKRSELRLMQDRDGRGNLLNHTLLRYLSSKGWKKDSVAITNLDAAEIKAIEYGVANAYYLNHNPIQNRIHETFFSIEEYRRSNDADGYSFLMRIEFWKTTERIIQRHFWIGTGTGDIKNAFIEQYEIDQSKLDERFRRRAHNQYLSFFAAFGLIGFLVFIISLFYPLFLPISNRTIYQIFLAIIAISFLTEDTLETQAGVTLFAFFNSLLLLGLEEVSQAETDNA